MDNNSHEMKLPHIYTHNNDVEVNVNDDNDYDYDNEDTTNRIHNDIKHIIYNRTQDNTNGNGNSNSNSNGDVFLTDKIKEPIITATATTSPQQVAQISTHAQTIPFNNLIINLKETPTLPKPINPLFFIINSTKPVNKTMNFQMNPGLIRTTDNDKEAFHEETTLSSSLHQGYMTRHEQFYSKLLEKNLYNKQHHDAFKTTHFDTSCFNKTTQDKIKLKTDIKKLIFNNNKETYEDRCKMIKNITKHEMMNRSSGQGMFLYTNNFRNEQRSIREINKQIQLEEMNDKNKMQINLRKTNVFDKKRNDKPIGIFFTKTFLKMTYDEYKNIQRKKVIEQLKEKEMNSQIKQMYGIKENGNNNTYDESCKRKGRRIGKDIDNMGYMKDKVNSRGILPKTHLDNFNQIRDKRLEEALIKADAKEFISKKKKLTLDLPI
jgi:hypothetical protein